ncbi:hypothetical protein SAMN04490357_4286 [Streptomyces misionensis]|uniref:Uncharacterized protein n=1 Tax=Streptomyces misionensis TaxID=67331 RepID=A0A1H4Z7G6_9ACTN|nr:DUF6232 family protein [Streptomyces misionensis]SED25374.1 hypothetical protein SAMN04490357_4286 [Streptomyces misionensis]
MSFPDDNGTPPTPDAPPVPPVPPAPPPALDEDENVVLGVRGRMLWIGEAAVPLRNITLVNPHLAKPDRWSAAGRLLMWLLVIVVIGAAAQAGSGGDARLGGPLLVLLIALVCFFCRDLFTRGKPVLAVETAGGAQLAVTLPSLDELRRIAGQIVNAINNPEAEFATIVHQYHSNSTNNYGPVVNMTGGRGNTGFKL